MRLIRKLFFPLPLPIVPAMIVKMMTGSPEDRESLVPLWHWRAAIGALLPTAELPLLRINPYVFKTLLSDFYY